MLGGVLGVGIVDDMGAVFEGEGLTSSKGLCVGGPLGGLTACSAESSKVVSKGLMGGKDREVAGGDKRLQINVYFLAS